jgi:Flp pilus assembly CpaF family ATPase
VRSQLCRNVLIGGTTGSGKNGIVNIVGVLAACRDVETRAVDLKGGMELAPWARPRKPTTAPIPSPTAGPSRST